MDHLDTFHNIADRYPDKTAILDHSRGCVHTIDIEGQSAQTFQLQEDIPRSGRRSAQHTGTDRIRGRSYARDGPVRPDTREDRLCPDVHIEGRLLYRMTLYQCLDRCPPLPHVQRSIFGGTWVSVFLDQTRLWNRKKIPEQKRPLLLGIGWEQVVSVGPRMYLYNERIKGVRGPSAAGSISEDISSLPAAGQLPQPPKAEDLSILLYNAGLHRHAPLGHAKTWQYGGV